MHRRPVPFVKIVAAIAILTLSPAAFTRISTMQATSHDRIGRAIDGRALAVIRGHLHPLARHNADQGPLDSSTPLPRITMAFKRTEAQQADLNTFLQDQQDPSSPDYHHRSEERRVGKECRSRWSPYH